MLQDLRIGLAISTPSGLIGLENEFSGGMYSLEGSALAEIATTWRRQEATNPHVEGSYLVHAERENQVVPVHVWVQAPTMKQVRRGVVVLEQAFSQLQYEMQLQLDGWTENWVCQAADLVVDMRREYLHAPIALVKAQVPRLPQIRIFS